MLAELREAIWSELARGSAITVYRRNLQRGYLERMEWLMTEEPAAVPAAFRSFVTSVNVPQSDIRPFVRGELGTLRREIRSALNRGPNRTTRLHLEDALTRIDEILDVED
jgi:hypothetical protein